ncbi:MAG: hypothetical protein IRY99_12800 [Isosphaeraceae bacterium]|nr:hypothetical protein [Isosphaeraceae bacterium]
MNSSAFHGKLLDGGRVVFRRVSGLYEEDERGVWSGHLEVHDGPALMLRTDHPCRLVRDDGRGEAIVITGLRQSGTAGIARLAFRASGGLEGRGR